jgi:hypothetical protein
MTPNGRIVTFTLTRESTTQTEVIGLGTPLSDSTPQTSSSRTSSVAPDTLSSGEVVGIVFGLIALALVFLYLLSRSRRGPCGFEGPRGLQGEQGVPGPQGIAKHRPFEPFYYYRS